MATSWTNALPIGQPAHLVVCYDLIAGTAVLYVNGQRVGIGSATIPLNRITDINVWLGRSNWPDPYFNGQIHEFRIYEGVLLDSAVAASFAAGPEASLGGRPRLRVQRNGSNLQLTWPSDAAGYFLEGTTSLGAAAVWSPVTNAPVFQYDKVLVTLPTTNFSQFFRLAK
jgi:hypothetical protein